MRVPSRSQLLVVEGVRVLVGDDDLLERPDALDGSDDRERARPRVVVGEHLTPIERHHQLLEVVVLVEEAQARQERVLCREELRRVVLAEEGLQL